MILQVGITLPETKIAPENGWLEYEFPFWDGPMFRGHVSFHPAVVFHPTTNDHPG